MTHLSSTLWAEEDEDVISSFSNAFLEITRSAQLAFVALPSAKDQSAACVGYAFAMIGADFHIAMRRKNATWNISGLVGEVSFAVGSSNADQVSGRADWEASLLSAQDTAWAAQAWDLIRQKYPWFKPSHLADDPMVVKLKPKTLSLLRYDEPSDRLWRTRISAKDGHWKVEEHAAK